MIGVTDQDRFRVFDLERAQNNGGLYLLHVTEGVGVGEKKFDTFAKAVQARKCDSSDSLRMDVAALIRAIGVRESRRDNLVGKAPLRVTVDCDRHFDFGFHLTSDLKLFSPSLPRIRFRVLTA